MSGGGGGGSLAFAARVDRPIGSGVTLIANAAAISDDGAGGSDPIPGDNFSVAVTPLAVPDLQLVKDDGGVSVQAGGTVVYTLTFTNVGGDATGVEIEDTVPTNTTFDAAASTGGCRVPMVPGRYDMYDCGGFCVWWWWRSLVFAARVDRPIGSGVTLIANAAAISDDGAGGSDPIPGDNFSVAVTPLAVPDLQLVKDDGGVSVQAVDCCVHVDVYECWCDATGVEIEDTVPTNTTFDAAASTGGWSCADGAPAGTTCTIAVGSVSGGGGGSLVFAARVDRPIGSGVTLIANAAAISDDGAAGRIRSLATTFQLQ